MDSHSETEEQRDPSCSSHWRTITHLAPDPLPCLSRLIFHSSAEQSWPLLSCVLTHEMQVVTLRCVLSGSHVRHAVTVGGPEADAQCHRCRGCPTSFSKQLHKEENLHTVRLALLGLTRTGSTCLEQLWGLRLLNRLPAPALVQAHEAPGSFSSSTGLRLSEKSSKPR